MKQIPFYYTRIEGASGAKDRKTQERLQSGLPTITVEGFALIDNGNLYSDIDSVKHEARKIKFIPYYGMENRGETDMLVWIPVKA